MKDAFGRTVDYMRISVTDRCNLRCRYCMPDGVRLLPSEDLLTFEEITEIVTIAAELGISKIRLTGGEPLVRKGTDSLVGMLRALPGIEQIALTTNGILLADQLPALLEKGLDAVNISLDTLDREEFEKITGKDLLDAVLRGIDSALAAGLPVKINTVNRADLTEDAACALMEYMRGRRLDLRFIEMMPIGAGRQEAFRSNGALLEILEKHYGRPEEDRTPHGNGPARYYRFQGFTGSVGLISAMHGKFCGTCSRVRLTSTGHIKSCLCYETGADLRQPLRAGRPDLVRKRLAGAIYEKPAEHCFETPDQMTERQKMVSIGG